MSRLSKEEIARFSGANWLLDFAKEHGLEEAEKNLEQRGVRNIPLAVKESDLRKFEESEKTNLIKSMILISIDCMHDEFDFEKPELDRFLDRFNKYGECIIEKYVSWKDIQQTMADETGIWIPMPED